MSIQFHLSMTNRAPNFHFQLSIMSRSFPLLRRSNGQLKSISLPSSKSPKITTKLTPSRPSCFTFLSSEGCTDADGMAMLRLWMLQDLWGGILNGIPRIPWDIGVTYHFYLERSSHRLIGENSWISSR